MTALQTLGLSSWFSFFILPFVAALFLMQLFALIFLPVVMARREANMQEVGKAIYVYLLLACGTLLIVFGTMPVLVSLLSQNKLPVQGYGALVVLIGGGALLVFLLAKYLCTQITPGAAAVPRAIYFCAFNFLGAALSVIGVLYFLIAAISAYATPDLSYQPVGFWVMPVTLMVAGSAILFAFRCAAEGKFNCLCK